MDKSHNLLMLALVVIVLVSGVSLGYAATHLNATPSSKAVSLTLVISPFILFNNSTGDQPSYFILENGQLQSAENIYLPQYSTIDLTIIDWDSGASNVSTQYANVSETGNNQVAVFNNTAVHNTSLPQTNQSAWVTSFVNISNIAHTFTVSGNGMNVNIPVQPLSTEQATFQTSAPGQYVWTCNSMCGTGPNGAGGPMVTAGWMWGYINVM
jgi:hypothetical protein